MLPNDPGEFELRLTAGAFDAAIHRILTDADLDEVDEVASEMSAPALQDATLKQILERGKRLGRSRLWVARQFPAGRLHTGVVSGKGELSLTLAGPPLAGDSQEDMSAMATANALFSFGSKMQFKCGAEVKGAPLDLVLIAVPRVTRLEFDALIGFEKPKVAPAPREQFKRADRVPAMALNSGGLDIALLSATAGPNDDIPPIGTFNVVVDLASSQLEVSTDRLEGEDGLLLATVQFDGGVPILVILESGENERQTLRGAVPLPPAIQEGRTKAAIVVVHEVTPDELPLLNPMEASLWLAGQQSIVIPLSEDQGAFGFTLDEGDRRFLAEKPDAIIAVRVEPQTSEVGR
jgi:hypothetical protein